jgi:uncharacterized protein YndB with AHSA1/START domain
MIATAKTSVTNTINIAGPIGPVFDLVTTARFWPQWHPATESVAGVTQRPYQYGEFIAERGQIGPARFGITWKVIEHARPAHVVLACDTPPARITYSFRGGAQTTEFQRTVEYDPAVFASAFPDPTLLERYMYNQSQQALEQLKDLIEGILHEESNT